MSRGTNPLRMAGGELRIRRARAAPSGIPNPQSAVAGFTLVEVLLVVVMIAMIAGLGGGYAIGSYKRLLVEKTARQLLAMAIYARIMAIEQQRPYELQVDPGNQGFLLATTRVNEQSGETERVMVRDYYCRPVEFEGDVKFEDVVLSTATGEPLAGAEDEQKIIFLPNGSAESAVLQIGDGKTHYTVAVVAATGKATLYEGTATDVETVSIDLDLQ